METRHHDLQRLLVERIHHEDVLLGQRIYNYLTLNVFLGAVFTLTRESPGLGIVLSLAGAVLAAFQISLGHRTDVTLSFYREYLGRVEARTGLRVHRPLFTFYETSCVETPEGSIQAEDLRGAANKTRAWRALRKLGVLGSTNSLFGVIHPLCIGLIWAYALFDSLAAAKAGPPGLSWFVSIAVGVVIGYVAFFDKPSRPKREDPRQGPAVPPNDIPADDTRPAGSASAE
jgi:hypothetical protein